MANEAYSDLTFGGPADAATSSRSVFIVAIVGVVVVVVDIASSGVVSPARLFNALDHSRG